MKDVRSYEVRWIEGHYGYFRWYYRKHAAIRFAVKLQNKNLDVIVVDHT